MKNRQLFAWVWRWHFIGGLFSLPIILILAFTGVLYLFKDAYEEDQLAQKLPQVEQLKEKRSWQEQWDQLKKDWELVPQTVELGLSNEQYSVFSHGRFGRKAFAYINPYQGNLTHQYALRETNSYKVRKLHGELLLGGYGTKLVELVACWMIVLIITGLYLFWPNWQQYKYMKQGRRQLVIGLHSYLSAIFAIPLLLLLLGGLPWTDVWGGAFKFIQKKTNTGFPKEWHARSWQSNPQTTALSLDEVIQIVEQLDVEGELSLSLPNSAKEVYSLSNNQVALEKKVIYHLDAYSGEVLYRGSWTDIGPLMQARLWLMAFHQGEFGYWNFLLVLIMGISLFFSSLFALASYLYRKPKGAWGFPSQHRNFKKPYLLYSLIGLLGLLFPLFGLSLLLIVTIEWSTKNRKLSMST
ncbi:PepSY domain-containing protein [Saprospira sp. CCB-QB6]|uniref:PepSY-associated TM helix domain-containing protein n=1 Tax=Saprospira sp. CCB-QB6 TaxID=3023936 RepID=UPI00234A792D|nr:PepSY domain-containing protein [Saprospira sp. CCB-QB6]WCL82021.1 PepSY domain-containing protein [Saprospira sp. CCB-QB6]